LQFLDGGCRQTCLEKTVITSVENPRVKEVLRLRKARERRRAGLFLAEGRREVERALAAGLTVRSVYVAPELIPDWRGGEEVSARVLAKMSYRGEPEGVLAVVEIPQRPLPEGSTLLLVAVGIEKPGNLGAMARTADAAGADALLVAGAHVDPWNPNAVRASTGAVFTLPIVEATREEIAALPHTKVAAVLGASRSHTDADYSEPVAFLIGAEDDGLSGEWRAVADSEVEIPMRGASADSLNASAAAAVLLFEAVRQRASS
jgi:TrmH family RNA methyltransferase